VKMQSQAGFPALVVGGNLNFGSLTNPVGPSLAADIGKTVDGIGLLPTLNVRGLLMVGGTSPLFPAAPTATVILRSDRAKSYVPDFSEVGRTVQSVRVLEWEAQGQ
jgi:hypothetical protein